MDNRLHQKVFRTFSSKILLAGEYGILLGARGLAIPYPVYKGQLAFMDNPIPGTPKGDIPDSNRQLDQYVAYLESRLGTYPFLDLKRLRIDIDNGLCFNSDIPQGYGAGSSGALTAAFFDHYGHQKARELPLDRIRDMLALMEAYFHGASSGLDPLVSWADQPILIEGAGRVQSLSKLPPGHWTGMGLFLADTGAAAGTGRLVNWFMEQCGNAAFRHEVDKIYLPSVSHAIEALLQKNTRQLRAAFETISTFQAGYLIPMIPPHTGELFRQGLETGIFAVKLCGSGGGGFLLGITDKPEETVECFERKDFSVRFL